jgi:hypothetical protein
MGACYDGTTYLAKAESCESRMSMKSNTGVYPSGTSHGVPTLWLAPSLTHKYQGRLKGLVGESHASLFRCSVSDEEKKCYNLDKEDERSAILEV